MTPTKPAALSHGIKYKDVEEPRERLNTNSDVVVLLPCLCQVTFVYDNPALSRMTKPCQQHLVLQPFEKIRLLLETERAYVADPTQFKRL